jgi:Na+/glutamate symporter
MNGNTPAVNGKTPSWQSTIIALALIALVGGIFIAVFEKEGVDSALKVWAAIGTLVGVVTGVVPTYFFGQRAVSTANQHLEQTKETLSQEREKREEADAQAKVMLRVSDPDTVNEAAQLRPDLFE